MEIIRLAENAASRQTGRAVRVPIHILMPMAGHGSRFGKAGFELPKPLLPLEGEPLFWWAAESLRRCFAVRTMTFVILAEHEASFGLGRAILARYPDARIVALPKVTSGALETAVLGCAEVPDDGWLVVNDCDHAFGAEPLAAALPAMPGGTAGFLCHFHSAAPSYSYAEYDGASDLVRTVEKQPISDLAIAGAYGFRDRGTLLRHAEAYAADCPYPELFMSGIYNVMLAERLRVRGVVLDRHVSFGTPDELGSARARVAGFRAWRGA